jgi:hypothetical protein
MAGTKIQREDPCMLEYSVGGGNSGFSYMTGIAQKASKIKVTVECEEGDAIQNGKNMKCNLNEVMFRARGPLDIQNVHWGQYDYAAA